MSYFNLKILQLSLFNMFVNLAAMNFVHLEAIMTRIVSFISDAALKLCKVDIALIYGSYKLCLCCVSYNFGDNTLKSL